MTPTTYTVETAAAEAIEILKQWKSVRDEYLSARHGDMESYFHSFDIEEKMNELGAKAKKLMVEEIFADTNEYDVMDWMYDEYDALMSDLADIARGDY